MSAIKKCPRAAVGQQCVQPHIVSDMHGKACEGMAEADIVSDTIDKSTLKDMSDSTSGTALKMSDRNREDRETIGYSC